MFHSFFNSLARSRYLSFFSLSFRFILWSAGTAKLTILQILFFLLIIIIIIIRLLKPYNYLKPYNHLQIIGIRQAYLKPFSHVKIISIRQEDFKYTTESNFFVLDGNTWNHTTICNLISSKIVICCNDCLLKIIIISYLRPSYCLKKKKIFDIS